MRQRQVLVCESDERLAGALRHRAQADGWRLSEVRHLRVCLGLLPQGAGSVFVLRAGRDLLHEMTLVEQVGRLSPGTATIVVCDADNPALVNLAWDLGARFVLHPSQIRELLADVVAGVLA
jgi:DNA-binding response OmpR family regulator